MTTIRKPAVCLALMLALTMLAGCSDSGAEDARTDIEQADAELAEARQRLEDAEQAKAEAEAREEIEAAAADKRQAEQRQAEARDDSDADTGQAQAETVTRQLAGQHPILAAYAKATSELRERQTKITQSIERIQAKQAEVDAEGARVSENLSAAQQIVEIGSVGSELGEFLREMREQLPVLSALRDDIRDREGAIVDARLQRLNIDQRLRALNDPDREARRILAAGGLKLSKERDELRPMLQPLMEARRDALARLSEGYALQIEQFEHGRALAAGQHQAVDSFEIQG